MSRTIHIHSRIDALLDMPLSEFDRQFRGCITDNEGKPITTQQARSDLVRMIDSGIEVLVHGDCDDWDEKTGCRGHEQ